MQLRYPMGTNKHYNVSTIRFYCCLSGIACCAPAYLYRCPFEETTPFDALPPFIPPCSVQRTHPNPMQEARACYSFRDSGKCTYGDACKSSHLGESKTQVKTQVEGTTIGNSPTTTSTSPTQKKNYPNRTPKVKQQKLMTPEEFDSENKK